MREFRLPLGRLEAIVLAPRFAAGKKKKAGERGNREDVYSPRSGKPSPLVGAKYTLARRADRASREIGDLKRSGWHRRNDARANSRISIFAFEQQV